MPSIHVWHRLMFIIRLRYDVSGRPPDFLAFIITVLMMLLMAAGVRKSLMFNNVLNAVNLAVWVFIMAAGMFYVDSNNWSEHKGFLPHGWSGVSFFISCPFSFLSFVNCRSRPRDFFPVSEELS